MPGSSPVAKGLDDVIVGRSAISLVDGEAGSLVYRGFDLPELVPGTPYESIVHLLLFGDPPSADPAPDVGEELAQRRRLAAEAFTVVDALPIDLPPLEAMRTILSSMGHGRYGYPPTPSDGYDLIARLPILFARYVRRTHGLAAAPIVDGLSQVETYLQQLFGKEPTSAQVRALEGYFDMLADHGMNASTFALCIAISTESDLISAATAALGVLKGPRHGGAPSLVLDMLDAIGAPEHAPRWIEERLDRKELLFGFGHRVYKTDDPRSILLHQLAREIADPARLRLAEAVESAALAALRRRRPQARIYTNVEFYAGVLLEAVGLTRACFTPTFAIARTAGWSAHAIEQSIGNRVIRPDVLYDGPAPGRRWPRSRPGRS
ncbi:MAG: citrate/2-methylcitrate synthase [Thermoplasmata archaeon]